MLPELQPGQVLIGVSIEVPEPFGTQIQQARASFRDPFADAIPTHITLVGPTVIDELQIAEVHDHLTAVVSSGSSFAVHLQGTGTFQPITPVVFIKLVAGNAECAALEQAIRRGPLDAPARFAYHPHVTVAHSVPQTSLDLAFAEMSNYEAFFTVSAVHLYQHGNDHVWRPRHRYQLQGAG